MNISASATSILLHVQRALLILHPLTTFPFDSQNLYMTLSRLASTKIGLSQAFHSHVRHVPLFAAKLPSTQRSCFVEVIKNPEQAAQSVKGVISR